MRSPILFSTVVSTIMALGVPQGWGFLPPKRAPLPNLDPSQAAAGEAATAEQRAAATELRAELPNVRVDFDPTTGAPKMVAARDGMLTGAKGQGAALRAAAFTGLAPDDPDRVTKAFLQQHRKLFGFGPEALGQARVKREFVGAHNGLRTVVWEQQVEGIPVFEGVLVSHTTKNGELVNLSSRFVRDASQATARGTPNATALAAAPAVTFAQAAALAAKNLGEEAQADAVTPAGEPAASPEKHQRFAAPFVVGEGEGKLTWLPVDAEDLRLCWDMILTSRTRGEMFRVLVDAQTGEVRVRHCLTEYISDATYNVFTSDSPSPFSPGYSTPQATQPPVVSRALVTLTALNTNASPNGWIDDGGNQTVGNNVDAHTDWNNDNSADLPRPQGSPARVFNFPMDLNTQDPTNYSSAAVVQLFYWNNWMHDRLYELGFTEAAGNFQTSNFGRGGVGNDAVQADAQDGGGTDNANFSTPPDGSPGRMQMYIFTGPSPRRDGDLDAEVMLHEYTHGLSNRRVGGGVGMSALQSEGMGEGWSDFYAMALLSEPGDNVNGCYASGAYASYRLSSGFMTNYYFGIRRYPYCTDMTKNPLTFKDIDPTKASSHAGIPRSPIIGNTANEVHNMGEVWCVTLWEARANLINKLGYAQGNQLILQLVTDGMNLSPANPTFLEARDAILQADVVDTGGANRAELWAAFAKRGMGFSATAPASSTTSGVGEAYDVPDALSIMPAESLTSSGPVGGPFTPNPNYFTLTNAGTSALSWTLANTSTWVTVSPSSGTLTPGGPVASLSVVIGAAANALPLGVHEITLRFTNQSSGVVQTRQFNVAVVGRSMFDDFDPGIDLSQWSSFGGLVGSTVLATNYGGSVSSPNSLWFGDGGSRFAATMPIDTSGGGSISFSVRLADGASWPWEDADALPSEGVVLEFSTNSGATWTEIGNYDTSTYYSWTAVTLSIPVSAQAPATQFRWRQKSHSGSAYDHWALDNVTIDAGPTPPSIVTQPVNQTVPLGWTASFSALAAGSSPLSYQWQLDGTNLAGATTNPLLLSNVQSNQAGMYRVVVTNLYGSVTSGAAHLEVADRSSLVAVFTDPTFIDMTSGGTSSEGVNVQATLTNLGYQIITFTNIPTAAAANSVLLFPEQERAELAPSLTPTDKAALSNFVAQGGLFLVHGGEGRAGTLINTVFGLGVTESAQLGSGPTYSLTADAAGTVFDGGPASVPCNNGTSTLTNLPPGALSIYANAGLSAVALIPFGAGTIAFLGFDWYNALPIGTQDGGWVQVLGEAVLARTSVAPTIAMQPASQTVVVGDSVSFAVLASGSGPLTYQWRFNGTNLSGAMTSSLLLANVQFDQAGSYSVWVTNDYGAVTSKNAILTVTPPPPCAPPPVGLVGWWQAESNALDRVGTNHGTLSGGVTYTSGRVGQGFQFDGTSGYIDFGSNVANFGTNEFSVEFWLRSSATRGEDILNKRNICNADTFFDILLQNRKVAFIVDGGASSYGFMGVESSQVVADGVFHHAVMVRQGATLRIYVDGALSGTATHSAGQVADISSGASLRAGQSPCVGVDGTAAYSGALDEISLYNRALTGAEVQALYAAERTGKCLAPTPPTIVQQPASQVAVAGDEVNLTVIATGTEPMSYQWRLNGTNLATATSSSLRFTAAQVYDSGTYSVFLSNSVDTVLSSNAVVTVNPPPPCAAPPLGLVAWWRGQGNALDQAGGNNGVLTNGAGFAAGVVGQAFVFNANSNSYVEVPDSAALRLTNALTIACWARRLSTSEVHNFIEKGGDWTSGQTDYEIGVNDTYYGGAHFAFSFAGGWRGCAVTPDTAWHHYAAVAVSGQANPTLYIDGVPQPVTLGGGPATMNLIASTRPLHIGAQVDPQSGWNYYSSTMIDEVAMFNRALSPGEVEAIYSAERSGICVAPTPPTILSQPASRIVTAGDDVSFSVLVTGTQPMSYRWRRNGTNLASATTSALVFTNAQVSDSGTYSVLLSNSVDIVLSSNAVLTVNPPPPCLAPPIGLVSWWRAEGDALDQTGTNNGVAFGGAAFNKGRVGQAFDFTSGTGYVEVPASPNWAFGTGDFSIELWVNFASTGGTRAFVADDQGPYNVNKWIFWLNNDKLQFHLNSPTLGPTDFGSGAFNPVINRWYHVAVTRAGSLLSFYLDGTLSSTAPITVAVPDANVPLTIGQAENIAFLGGLEDELAIYNRALTPVEIGAIYAAERSGKCAVPTPPVILSQPTSQMVILHSNAVLNVLAAGTGPLAYQWRRNQGLLTGETSSTLFFPAVSLDQSGSYDVVITNTVGTLTSSVAVLTVYVPPPPVFTLQPEGQAVPAGTNFTLTALATDTWPIAYQWYLGGSALPGATNNILDLPNVQAANAGDYTLVAANPWNSATSDVATVTVLARAPVLTLQPQSVAAFPGFAAHLEVTAVGTEPLDYQWQFRGTNIPGATGTSYNVTNVEPEDLGRYQVLISNSVGQTTSAEALLVLSPVASLGASALGLMPLPLWITNAVAVSAGSQHNLALRRDGTVLGWGAANQLAIPDGLTNAVAVSAGTDHSVALLTDGKVVAWGSGYVYGQTNVPANLTNAVAVAAGASHSLALQSNGLVRTWGLNGSGQCSVPANLTNVVAITAGGAHSVALKADGTVVAWGNNTYGQTSVPANLSDVVAVAAGAEHTLALRSDGTVVAWGNPTYGRTNVPAGLSNVLAIAAGGYHSLAVKADRSVVAWGAGTNSVPGTYPDFAQSFIPSVISNIVGVAGGEAHTLALAGDGPPFITEPPVGRFSYSGRRVVFRAGATGARPLSYRWQVGNHDIPGATNQLLVMDAAVEAGDYRLVVSNALGVAVSPGAALTLVDSPPLMLSQPVGQTVYLGCPAVLQVTVDGSGPLFYQWRLNGTNIAGATGSTLFLNHVQASQAGNYSVVVSNAFGAVSSAKAAVPVIQTVAWGAGTNYTGSPNYGQSVVPSGLLDAVAIAGGCYHSLAVRADGSVLAWGAGTNYLSPPQIGQSMVPPNLPPVTAVAGGLFHSLALRADGLVAAWGAGTSNYPAPNYGQSMVPAGLSNVVAIAAGDYHSVALKSDGKIAAWGYYSYSITNVPTTATNVVAIASRANHVLALRADGTLVHWGSQSTLPPAPYNYVAVAAGVNHSLALRSDGTVVSWGSQATVPAGLRDVVEIAAGYDHSLALRSDGTVVTWGVTNTYGRNLIPVGLTNVVGIACGYYNSLAVLGDGSPVVKVPPFNRAAYLGSSTNFSVMAVGAQPLRYQWQRNGANIPGATTALLPLTFLHSTDAGNYRVVVSNIFNSTTSAVASLTVLVPLGEAVDSPGRTWSTSGNAAWAGESDVTHDTVDAAQSGLITDNQSSTLQTTVIGPGHLSFWWKVSSEEWFDYLNFYIDGTKQAAISGEVDWQPQSFVVGSGSHTLKWTYSKDMSVSVGADAAWLDEVGFVLEPPVITLHPLSQHGAMGDALVLTAAAFGLSPISYQWVKDGANLSGATATSLMLSPATRRDSGVYQFIATNPGGSTASSNATIVVRSPQTLGPPLLLPGGGFALLSADADGGPLLPADLPCFQAQATTNFVDWEVVLNGLTVTNGMLLFTDPGSTNYPLRFYRIIELDDAAAVTNPPVITLQPQGQTVDVGAPIELTVAATGAPPLNYQWTKDGTNLAGATASSLVISNATRRSGGEYVAVVSNPVGWQLSSNATVVVNLPGRIEIPLR